MEKVLTEFDKKYLRKICNYLGSYGLNHAYIQLEYEEGFEVKELNWDAISRFSNNYSVEIPLGLKEILKKILESALSDGVSTVEDFDNLNYEEIEIWIECEKKEISVLYAYSFTKAQDATTMSWDANEVPEVFESLSEMDIDEATTKLTLEFSGYGDDGMIESHFDSGEDVPKVITDWCESTLEDTFGNWGDNEGSQGNFYFHLDKKVVNLYFSDNVTEHETNTLWEENF